jgi:tetratricopeptide (TPR) repeat protein
VSGRPAVNLSFAINYQLNRALGLPLPDSEDAGDETISYHVADVLLHLGAGLLLFAIVRRTLRSAGLAARWSSRANTIAGAAALLWLVHPIQTEAVDYLSQRTELMVSVCYLGVLYAAMRAWTSARWAIAAVGISVIGMLSKEVMATAPVVVVLYDWAFAPSGHSALAGSVDARRRIALYAALFATALVAVGLALAGGRGESAGFGGGVSWHAYLVSQGWAIWRYMRLLILPAGLSFDYGDRPVLGAASVAGLLALAIIGIGVVAAWTRPRLRWLGFLGAWFFLLLAPSSSIVPIQTEIAAERRVYLAIAAPIVLAVVALDAALRRWFRAPGRRSASRPPKGKYKGTARDATAPAQPSFGVTIAAAVVAVVLLCASNRRSATYDSPEALWLGATRTIPGNWRAFDNLAALDLRMIPPRIATAESLLHHAIAADSASVRPWTRLAGIAIHEDSLAEAERLLEHALMLAPRDSEAIDKLAQAFLAAGKPDSAVRLLELVTSRSPTAEPLVNLGSAYLQTEQFAKAAAVLRRATQLDSTRADALVYLGGALVEMDSGAAATSALERAVRREPDQSFDIALLSLAYAEVDRRADAARLALASAERSAGDPAILSFCGRALLRAGRVADADRLLARAAQLAPNDPRALSRFAVTRAAMGDRGGAAGLLRRAFTVAPGDAFTRHVADSLGIRL